MKWLVALPALGLAQVQITLFVWVAGLPCPAPCPEWASQTPFIVEEIQTCQDLLDTREYIKCFLGVSTFFSGRSLDLSNHRDLNHGSVLDVSLRHLEDLLNVTRDGIFERSIMTVHLPAPAITACTYYRADPLTGDKCPDSLVDTSEWYPIEVGVGSESFQFSFNPDYIHTCLLSSCSVAETGMNLAESQVEYDDLRFSFNLAPPRLVIPNYSARAIAGGFMLSMVTAMMVC
eukprot:Protomagalhaensia_wolfi_Nauph_80__1338@NODE_179_length_3278_cov_264_687249_g135_i0_p3_GENE_NODE_179_length_3278_cov_264_687249_g135_i0NODE_179_length_3278_cov_264_687249_g135_i0_p3_ORF_typecomplete_len232_score23_64_NODE_179_length_3278_cov_264_687249_g135_i06591354